MQISTNTKLNKVLDQLGQNLPLSKERLLFELDQFWVERDVLAYRQMYRQGLLDGMVVNRIVRMVRKSLKGKGKSEKGKMGRVAALNRRLSRLKLFTFKGFSPLRMKAGAASIHGCITAVAIGRLDQVDRQMAMDGENVLETLDE
jgi:hypothetical protein